MNWYHHLQHVLAIQNTYFAFCIVRKDSGWLRACPFSVSKKEQGNTEIFTARSNPPNYFRLKSKVFQDFWDRAYGVVFIKWYFLNSNFQYFGVRCSLFDVRYSFFLHHESFRINLLSEICQKQTSEAIYTNRKACWSSFVPTSKHFSSTLKNNHLSKWNILLFFYLHAFSVHRPLPSGPRCLRLRQNSAHTIPSPFP